MTFQKIQAFDPNSFHYDKEVVTFTLYVKVSRLLHAYRGVVDLFWPDGGDYAMAVRRDPDILYRYNLVGTGAVTGENSALMQFSPIRPKIHGYLEATENQSLPDDLRESPPMERCGLQVGEGH